MRDGRVEQNKVLREGLRILNNLSLGAGQQFFVADTITRTFSLYEQLKSV